MVQFLEPETDVMVQFLAPEIVIMGERNFMIALPLLGYFRLVTAASKKKIVDNMICLS